MRTESRQFDNLLTVISSAFGVDGRRRNRDRKQFIFNEESETLLSKWPVATTKPMAPLDERPIGDTVLNQVERDEREHGRHRSTLLKSIAHTQGFDFHEPGPLIDSQSEEYEPRAVS